MQAISLIGNKKSGKTALATKLCVYLASQGLRVAAAKFTSHGFERSDSDTALLAQKCQAVVGISPSQSVLIWPRNRFLMDLIPLLEADVLIIEGGRDFHCAPRILLPHQEGGDDRDLDPQLAVGTWKVGMGSLPIMDTVEEVGQLIRQRGFLLPGLDCGSCGRENCAQLAMDIVRHKASVADCQAMKGSMSIRVNGQEIGVNAFVESIISGGIKGMLAQLKGYAPGRIDISMEL